MRIRTLVPALACLAAAPAFIAAADTAPVKLDGYVDTIYNASSSKTEDTSTQATGFNYFAKLGAEISISDKVGGQIDITNNGNSYTDNGVYIRQAYGTWKITPEVTFKSGRFIDCIGWTAAYATGLNRVNTGPITSLYGVDSPVGIDATYAKGDMSVEGTIVNGFFGEGAGETQQTSDSHHNAYAYMVDGTMSLPDKKGSVDAEAVYEADASDSLGGAEGGAGIHLGINASLTPVDGVKVGLEAIYQKINDGNDAGAGSGDVKNLGLLAQVNYAIPNNAWGASVTGSVEYVKKTNTYYDATTDTTVNFSDGSSQKATEVAVALLTTPAGTPNLGVNAEVAYQKTTNDDGATTSTSTKAWTLSLEALYIIP